jgi:hypothetical protein
MIRQHFRLDHYDWNITVYYSIHGYYVDEIMQHLERIGIKGKDAEQAYQNLSSGEVNKGLTFAKNGEAIAVIGKASSAAQYADSIQHEVQHLSIFIADAEGIPLKSEEVCYMGGEIARKMWPKSRFLTSSCGCYTYRIGKVL